MIPFLWFISKPLFIFTILVYGIFKSLIFIDATTKSKSLKIGFLSVIAAFIQLTGYGIGFFQEGIKRIFEPKNYRETGAAIEYPS